MDDMKININGEDLDILFTFVYNNKSYVVYEDTDKNISASIYVYENNSLELFPIETEDEWNYVDKMIEEMNN